MGPIYAVAAAGAAAGTVYYWNKSGGAPNAANTSAVKSAVSPAGNKAFKGGDQGFIDLKLENVEEINHNTRRFRFALPEKDDVSGLSTACTQARHNPIGQVRRLMRLYSMSCYQVPRAGDGEAGHSAIHARQR